MYTIIFEGCMMIYINKKSKNISNILKFIIPSLLGVILFIVPIRVNNNFTILVKAISDLFIANTIKVLPIICFIVLAISAVGSFIWFISNKSSNKKFGFIKRLDFLKTNIVWLSIKIISLVFSTMVYFNMGLTCVIDSETGGFIFNDLITTLVVIFSFAGFLLPLLLDFGLLEFVGTLLVKFMRPIFKLPGRSAVDCITSWLGDGTLGVMLTAKQYEDGYYSEKEAAIISTTFSAVSITFALVVIETVGLTGLFAPYYLSVCIIGIVLAIVVPRIPPLSTKNKRYYNDKSNLKEEIQDGQSVWKVAFNSALYKTSNNHSIINFISAGFNNTLDMLLGVLPNVMAVGTIILVIAKYTSLFTILGMPFIPLLKILGLPEASEASKCILVGFGDMLTPAIIGSTITSQLTRFVIAVISVTQLIYMSEVGSLILSSKIPVKLWELFIIFIERTIISLVIASIIGKYLLHLI